MSDTVIPCTMVPAFPYEGALYWLFSERGTESYEGSHPYYLTLYGPAHYNIVPKATALAALFDKLILAPADARLPDYDSYGSGGEYAHPDLRVSMSWKHSEWDEENEVIAAQLMIFNSIQKLLSSVPIFAKDDSMKRHFLCRTLLQMRIANENKSILIGNTFFNHIHDEIVEIIGESLQVSGGLSEHAKPWKLDVNTLDVVGLEFAADNTDTFAAIRQSKEISEYAVEFRSAIANAISSPDISNTLLELMKKAMDQEKVMNHAAQGFKTLGSVASVGGLIPLAGTITSATSISADMAGRALEKIKSKKRWYLLGPKMKEVALRDMLSKL